MVEKLEVPENILGNIEKNSKELRESGKITSGELFGVYRSENEAIHVVSKHEYFPKRQNNNGDLSWWSIIKNFPMEFLIAHNEIIFDEELEDGKESGGVYYFSNLTGRKFDGYHKDLLNFSVLENFDYKSLLMYCVEDDKFRALGEEEQPINVEPVNNSKLKDDKKLDVPYREISE